MVATTTCLVNMRSNPERVIELPQALRNNSGVGASPRTASQARMASPTDFHSARTRSQRPLPRNLGLVVMFHIDGNFAPLSSH